MDGLIDVEEEDVGVAALEDVGLSEVDDPATVDEKEELHLLVGSRLFHLGEELAIPSHWVDLILNILALEEFLYVWRGTEKILRVQRESRSTAEKTTIET